MRVAAARFADVDLGQPGKNINDDIITNNARCMCARTSLRSGLTGDDWQVVEGDDRSITAAMDLANLA